MKVLRKQRVGRILVEEIEYEGVTRVFFGGQPVPISFHEAVVKAKQAPLIKIRDECRRIARSSREHIERVRREDGLDGHDIEEAEHDDY